MDALAQLSAALSDRYAVEREIGAGGMATVYLARDLRHDRNVALKVLNPELGAVLGVERFLSEIRVTANLQHPNLLPLFDSGQADGLLFYVMPFVEGESLRRRLEREKQLPVDEAVRIAVAIANALDYAHSHGVVHRDLKPENILLQHGQPVIADFGIALAISNAGGGRITQTGLSLGTPQYMSPEQATGDRVIDGRTDIYSLGAVLYEMLTGEPPHAAATAQAIIAKLMTEEVRPLTVLRKSVPPYLDAAVRRALEKLPADRYATAAQFADALLTPRVVAPETGAQPVAAPAPERTRARSMFVALPWAVAVLGVAYGVRSAITRPAPAALVPVHFTLPIKAPLAFDPARSTIAVSPDGSHIAFTASSNANTMQAFIRSVADDEPHAVPGTESSSALFFSPDGAWLGFRGIDAQLKRVPISGGPSTTITNSSAFTSPSWSSKDMIVFAPAFGTPLSIVPGGGGRPARLTVLDSARGESFHSNPTFLPGGDAVVFAASQGSGRERRLEVATLDGRVTPLDLYGTNPMFVAPDILVFVRLDGVAEAVRFDPKSHHVSGKPVQVLEGITMRGAPPLPTVSASANGNLFAYVHGLPRSRLALLSATGETQLLPPDARRYRHPRVSPSGDRIVVDISAPDGAQDVWVYDIKSTALSRLTFDGRSTDPTWSPDGKRIAFSRVDTASGAPDVYTVAADGSEQPRLFIGGAGAQYAGTWTPDGKSFVYDELITGRPMHMVMVDTSGASHSFADSPTASMRLPATSPDGRWVAYSSNESGHVEIYVRSLSGPGRWQVSISGGTQPVWSRDGKTLFYRENGHIVAATVGAGGAGFTVASRRTFAEDHFVLENTINFDAMPDGKHLAVIVPMDEGAQISVIVNWNAELEKRLKP